MQHRKSCQRDSSCKTPYCPVSILHQTAVFLQLVTNSKSDGLSSTIHTIVHLCSSNNLRAQGACMTVSTATLVGPPKGGRLALATSQTLAHLYNDGQP